MFRTPLSPYEIAGLLALLAFPVLLLAVVGRVSAFRRTESMDDDDQPNLTRTGGSILAVGGLIVAAAGVVGPGPYRAAVPFGLAIVVMGAAAFATEPTTARWIRHAGLAVLVVAGLLLPLLLDL